MNELQPPPSVAESISLQIDAHKKKIAELNGYIAGYKKLITDLQKLQQVAGEYLKDEPTPKAEPKASAAKKLTDKRITPDMIRQFLLAAGEAKTRNEILNHYYNDSTGEERQTINNRLGGNLRNMMEHGVLKRDLIDNVGYFSLEPIEE